MTNKPERPPVAIIWWRVGSDAWAADLLDDHSEIVRPHGCEESFMGVGRSHAAALKRVRKLAAQFNVPRKYVYFDPDTTAFYKNS